PLWPEVYKEYIENEISDLRNLSKYIKEAGTITAGLFLKEFADNYPFTHLDIAGPAMKSRETRHLPKGGTAFGLRLLYEYIKTKR
ncbi:MAG: leucyl aminopeptidase, partial [Nanoarchaeota archaeon]